jgi:hypothetical protein
MKGVVLLLHHKLSIMNGTNSMALASPSLTLEIPTFKPLTADITADFNMRNKMGYFKMREACVESCY